MFSVNRGFEGGDAGGPQFSLAFTRFPRPVFHVVPIYSLCAEDRRTHTASIGVVPLVGDQVADLP